MSRSFAGRRVTASDVALVVGLVAVVAALGLPTLRARGLQTRIDEAAARVDTLRAEAERHRQRAGAWPAPGDGPGTVPAGMTGLFPGRERMAWDAYTLEWAVWEVVDRVEAPRPTGPEPSDTRPDSVGPDSVSVVRRIGGVTVHSAQESLLAALLGRYGRDASFVRDTTWTLVLPRRSGGG